MAHLTEGAIISEIRGSIGSRTFSKNAYGPYVKDKITQPFSNSPRQQTNRALFKDAVEYWQAMNESERQLWRQFAHGKFRTNSLGVKYRLTPYHLFISCYINIVTIYGSYSIQSWNIRPTPRLTDLYTANLLGNLALFTPADDYHEDYYAMWSMSQQYDSDKRFVNPGELRYCYRDEANQGGTFPIQQLYNATWGGAFLVNPSKVIHVSVKFVNGFNGLQSPTYFYRVQCIVNGYIH